MIAFRWLLLHRRPASVGICANRHLFKTRVGAIDVEVTLRDTRKPGGYSREELYEMGQRIRDACFAQRQTSTASTEKPS